MGQNLTRTKIRYFESGEITILDRYDEEIGRGGSAIIRRCRHTTLSMMALKCFPISKNETFAKIQKERIKKEIRLQQLAQHTNVVPVHGWSHMSHEIRIIMNYFPDGDLARLLGNNDVALNLLKRLRICYNVSNGLEYIHAQQIVHGDIKPENILLTKNLHAKIGDFGSAQLLGSAEEFSSAIISLLLINPAYSPLHAPPEFHENSNSLKQPSYDTYSFAVTMLRVLGREIPIPLLQLHLNFKNINSNQQTNFVAIKACLHDVIPKDKHYKVKIVDVMTDVMTKCWQENPTHRPLMKDVKTILQNLHQNNSVMTSSSKSHDNKVKWEKKENNLSRDSERSVRLKRCFISSFYQVASILKQECSAIVGDEPNDETSNSFCKSRFKIAILLIYFVLIRFLVNYFEKSLGFWISLILCFAILRFIEKQFQNIIMWLLSWVERKMTESHFFSSVLKAFSKAAPTTASVQ